LIVDDQIFNIDAALIIFGTKMKIDTSRLCSIAFNGKEAFQKVKESVEAHGGVKCGYYLILMDCNMPFMDGYEATQSIRQYLYSRGISQPVIIAVTGHTEPAYVQRCIESGMNQVLSKPVDDKLLHKLFLKLQNNQAIN
jgi:CheY-like chemotaxis protein